MAERTVADVLADQFLDPRWENQLSGRRVVDCSIRDHCSSCVLLP